MRNLFWLVAGAVLAWFVIMKGRAFLHRLTPAGVAQQVEKTGNQAAASFGDFYATFKTSMAAREAELREELGVTESN